MVFRDANGEESHCRKRCQSAANLKAYRLSSKTSMISIKLAHQLALTHSADQEEPHDTKQKLLHTFKVIYLRSSNPTGYALQVLKGALQANVTTEYEVRWNGKSTTKFSRYAEKRIVQSTTLRLWYGHGYGRTMAKTSLTLVPSLRLSRSLWQHIYFPAVCLIKRRRHTPD